MTRRGLHEKVIDKKQTIDSSVHGNIKGNNSHKLQYNICDGRSRVQITCK
jgi:hypothetical protein